jgi:uncharacterized membrane protein YccC
MDKKQRALVVLWSGYVLILITGFLFGMALAAERYSIAGLIFVQFALMIVANSMRPVPAIPWLAMKNFREWFFREEGKKK